MTMKQKASPSTLWRSIAGVLTDRINDGTYPDGYRLPGEVRLAEEFGCHRNTVRRALSSLESMGLIRGEQGRGTFVRRRRILYPISSRTRFTANLARHDLAAERRLLGHELRPANEVVAEALALPLGAPVLRVEAYTLVDGQRFDFQTSYHPAARFQDLAERLQANAMRFTETFRSYGITDYTRVRTLIWAAPANVREAEVLMIKPAGPILLTEYVNQDQDHVPIQYSLTRFNAATTQLEVETPI